MKVILAQLNPTVGDIKGNTSLMEGVLKRVYGEKPDLIVFPELFLTGYPPRDLLERDEFLIRVEEGVKRVKLLSAEYPETGILTGVTTRSGKMSGKGLYNSALLLKAGKVMATSHKSLLPYYDVFDETRYFDPAPARRPVRFGEEVLGIMVCEDAWNDPSLWKRRLYPIDPVEELARKGATLFIDISASPFHLGKDEVRFNLISNHARRYRIPFIFVNQVGGNDELVFDGRSFFVDKGGNPVMVLPPFAEEVALIETGEAGDPLGYVPVERLESLFLALVTGIRDYVRKCGFSRVVLGLSGGIDSAVSACLAKEALGAGNVLGVTLPSPYSSGGSVDDSRRLASNLGIRFKEIPISSIYGEYLKNLSTELGKGDEVTLPMENIQSRIRGNILMALSNRYGYLLLSSGNKSELAVGYCTLYGDMTGGLAVISDLPKTMVYELARYLNRGGEVIPKEIMMKRPSAELKPGQADQDTLPPYELLDPILHLYLEEGFTPEEIMEEGFDEETVNWVAEAVKRSEYKRRQAPPGIKVTTKAFGAGRRMPVAARY